MFDLLKARFRHGYQAVKNIRGAKLHEKYRGFPVIKTGADLDTAASVCPSHAISLSPPSIDIGRCVFCNGCARITDSIAFTNFHYTSTTSREKLIIRDGITPEIFRTDAVTSRKKIRSMFGRSLRLRSVSAGGCNACELELNACSNVNFDIGRYGIDMVASPRHADGIIITGPVTENMAYALDETYNAIPDPRIVIAMGSCAISGGIFSQSPAIDRQFFDLIPVDLYIPGCPPHPLTVINGVLDLIGRRG